MEWRRGEMPLGATRVAWLRGVRGLQGRKRIANGRGEDRRRVRPVRVSYPRRSARRNRDAAMQTFQVEVEYVYHTDLVFSPDGLRCAAVDVDGTGKVVVWDVDV